MRFRQPTIKDVAKRAGVSPMTASRVANGLPNVRLEKREAVLRAMRELDYAPHAAAQTMRTQRTRRIGFMMPDITNMTNAVVSQAVERQLAEHRYHLMLFNTDFKTSIERDVLAMAGQNMFDGLIAALADDTDPTIAAALAACKIPVVLIDRETGVEVDSVLSDHRTAMRTVVRKLVDLGHRRLALISSSRGARPGRGRIDAFTESLIECGLPVCDDLIRADEQSIAYGRLVTLSLMAMPEPPTALIAGANQLTLGAYQALREAGLAIPEDLSFVGTDDPYLSSLLWPPITVIYRDMDMVGRYAAELILSRLNGTARQKARTITVPSEIAWRGSIAPAKSAGKLRRGA